MIRTYGVGASGYRNIMTMKEPLTHSYDVDNDTVLCTKVQDKHILVDENGNTDPTSRPTCKMCARRDPRFKK